GRPTWPAERTVLTSGALDFLLQSKLRGGETIATPQLKLEYRSDWNWREPPAPPPNRPLDGREAGTSRRGAVPAYRLHYIPSAASGFAFANGPNRRNLRIVRRLPRCKRLTRPSFLRCKLAQRIIGPAAQCGSVVYPTPNSGADM